MQNEPAFNINTTAQVNTTQVNTSQLTRRQLLAWSSATLGVVAAAKLANTAVGQTPDKPVAARNRTLVRPSDITELNTRNKMVLELEGILLVNEPDTKSKQKNRDAAVKAKSTVDFYELAAFDNQNKVVSAARDFLQAEAEHWVAGNTSTSKLRDTCGQTIVINHGNQWQQFCQAEPMLVTEVELLLAPINTNVIELLLPETPAKVSQPWTISKETARELFNLEAVHECTLVASISKVEEGVASVDLNGTIQGTANSVSTELKIKGNFQAKLASECAIVSWVGLAIQEKRAISQSEPGFDIVARIRLIREEQTHEWTLDREKLLELSAANHESQLTIKLGSAMGRYAFLADRQWKTYIDTGEEAIFRLIKNNSIIAQCNVTRLPKLDPGKQLTLAALQQEIRQSLKSNSPTIVEASERLTSNKLKLMRVLVTGKSEDVPIQWVYAHLSDDSGQRLSLVFTMGANVAEVFAGADEQICSTLELYPEPTPKDDKDKPEEAPKLSNAPKPAAKR
jgi:hypothetical protein